MTINYMCDAQNELFDNLMKLPELSEAFYSVDQILGSITYRIFLYRLASYSDWMHADAIESRGITFRMDGDTPVDMVSRPLHKFFNLHENPFTMDLDLSTLEISSIQDKRDGSLISSMIGENGVWLKSKGSLFSEQAQAANALLLTDEYESLKDFLYLMIAENITVSMEYTAPTNRIVIGYMEPALSVLALRHNDTGTYIPLEFWEHDAGDAARFFVKNIADGIIDKEDFINNIPYMDKIEGFVIHADNISFKVKTEWYMVLHHLKDSINSQRRLYEAVVYETIDDVRAQFYDDPLALQTISDMEALVAPIYNNMVALVSNFYENNKHLDRKEYAIKGQAECGKLYFGLAMGLYLGREPDYKGHMVKYRKDYGIKEDPIKTPMEIQDDL